MRIFYFLVVKDWEYKNNISCPLFAICTIGTRFLTAGSVFGITGTTLKKLFP